MITCYIIQEDDRLQDRNVILEFDAEYEEEARETFTQYVRTKLVEDPNCRFVDIERTLGGWINKSLAHATAEDLLDMCPYWFTVPGFYDKPSHRLVLAASETIDRINYQYDTYYVTTLKPEGSKEWQRRSLK